MVQLEPTSWPLTALEDDENWKVMQYTGLKDTDDKEIYEGDIVSGEKHLIYLYDRDDENKRGYVQWADGIGEYWVCNGNNEHTTFKFVQLSGGDSSDDTVLCHNLEVIGNIYKNPELLAQS